jgi:hypothetical protein
MRDIETVLHSLAFLHTLHVQNRTSIADLFVPSRRCGIYVLQFLDGEVYAGQAVDVTRRYLQHRRSHGDIEYISFKTAPRSNLNEEERRVIWTLERNGYHLRNITFTSAPSGESDFDLVMPADERMKWLNDLAYVNSDTVRTDDIELRRKYARRFQRFNRQPFAQDAVEILRIYVQACIPAILRSELSFWSVSCLPGFSVPGITIYSRVNINWQEVFTIFSERGVLGFSWHLAAAPLEEAFGKSLSALFAHHPTIERTDHFYEPGGQDQMNLVTQDLAGARALLRDRNVIRAIRLFNLRLMIKGPCAYSRYHCFELADRLVMS